jgi:hypothetical protein
LATGRNLLGEQSEQRCRVWLPRSGINAPLPTPIVMRA